MVQITIKIRPQRSYTYANSIKQATVDSSHRFEQILSELKLSKKGTSLHKSTGVEIPLNSAIASHNIQDNEIIETCSSPILSALLSATIGDIENLQQNIDENNRTSDVIKSLLMDTESSNDYFELSDWEPSRWSFKDARRRLICLKTMKQLLQRNGRYATIDTIPQCNDLNSLYDFIQTSGVFRHNEDKNNKNLGGFSTIEHCFKPKAKNRNGKPSILWDLLQQKMDKFNKIVIENIDNHNSSFDPIEAFVKIENERQKINSAQYTNTPMMPSPSTDLIDSTQQQETQIGQRRKRRNLAGSSHTAIPEEANQTHIQLCVSCKLNEIRCICLTPSCPFEKKPYCQLCFESNHPIVIRNHECIPWNDSRAKAARRQIQKEYAGQYCPEYKSGPFSILCTLYEAMYRHTGTRRQLNLTEKKLKELAQPRCRANLYDRQARGRTAFACMEKLTSDGFLRKEIIPGSNGNSSVEEENTIFSLLPKGEKLGKFCLEFEDSINSIVENEEMKKNRSIALTGCYDAANLNSRNSNSDNVSIIIDSREDKLFAKRLMNRCQTSSVNYILRDLPAGDYLFTTKISTNNRQQQQSREEMVLPLVIERKTWSDLADSVSGHGRKRLDCVKIDSSWNSNETTNAICGTNCQLCKMKKSSCPQIMFIIEGGR